MGQQPAQSLEQGGAVPTGEAGIRPRKNRAQGGEEAFQAGRNLTRAYKLLLRPHSLQEEPI